MLPLCAILLVKINTFLGLFSHFQGDSRQITMNMFDEMDENVLLSPTGKRKRRNPAASQRELQKKARHSGVDKIPSVNCAHNNANCQATTLSVDDLNYIFNQLYSTSNKVQQDAIILANINCSSVKRHREKIEDENKQRDRRISIKYSVLKEDKETIQVCQSSFLSIFCIKKDRVQSIAKYWLEKGLCRPEHRGGARNLDNGEEKEHHLDLSSDMEEIDPEVLQDSPVEIKDEYAIEEIHVQDINEPEDCSVNFPVCPKEELTIKEETLDERDMELSKVHNPTQGATAHDCPEPQILDIRSLMKNDYMGVLREGEAEECPSSIPESVGTFRAPKGQTRKRHELDQRYYQTFCSPSTGKPETHIILSDNDGTSGFGVSTERKRTNKDLASKTLRILNTVTERQICHRDKFYSYCQYLAAELREMDKHSAAYVQKLFADIILKAKKGEFKQNGSSLSEL